MDDFFSLSIVTLLYIGYLIFIRFDQHIDKVLGLVGDLLPPHPGHPAPVMVREVAGQELVEDDPEGPTVGLGSVGDQTMVMHHFGCHYYGSSCTDKNN